MLSFGIEASRALAMASASRGLPSGSPPPSLAATVIARASLVKSLPRRESTIAFLCLIPAHLECPDMWGECTCGPAPRRARERRAWRPWTARARSSHGPRVAGYSVRMPDYQGRREADLAASPEACFDALTDYDSMPQWQRALKRCTVVEHGDGTDVVEFEVDAKLRTIRYRLRLLYHAPHRIDSTYLDGPFRDF